jgi:hypothetical protein
VVEFGKKRAMNEFPFTDVEWDRVKEVTLAMLNATLADDEVLRASRMEEFRWVLFDLRATHGEHPILLETEADFTDEPTECVALYQQAKHMALANGLLTYTIRISLARAFLYEMNDPGRAQQELLACREEVAAWADEHDQEQWQEMQAECDRQNKNGARG